MSNALILYSQLYCPFCIKVLRYLESRDIDIEIRDVMETPKFRDELISIGGKSQVPCLIIDGKPLYESDDIMKWFEEHYE